MEAAGSFKLRNIYQFTQRHMPGNNSVQRTCLVKCKYISEVQPNNLCIYTSPRDTFISFSLILEGIVALGQLATLVERQAPDLSVFSDRQVVCSSPYHVSFLVSLFYCLWYIKAMAQGSITKL
jgi:hypothetical protein